MQKKKLKYVVMSITTVIMMSLIGCAEEKVEEVAPDVSTQASAAEVTETELEWKAQPELGIVKGDYFKEEERFRQGHLGMVEVVINEDKIVKVEFNENTRPNYYLRYYQDVPKRYSEYNFDMGEKKGVAWIQGVLGVEKQMIEKQVLSGEFDIVSGASNSVNQAMLPLSKKIEDRLSEGSNQKYYSIAEELGGGLTGQLKVVVEDSKILSCRYDEIFADSPDKIEDEKLKKFYRTSKYESVEYDEPSRIGFNIQMDELNAKVIDTQNMLDLEGLPSIEATGDYGKSGYTERNTAWDNYLNLAEKLINEMKADDVL